MQLFTEIIPVVGGAIIGPPFLGAFVLAASQTLYNKFISKEADWGKNISGWQYFVVAWITGALTMFSLYWVGEIYRSLVA